MVNVCQLKFYCSYLRMLVNLIVDNIDSSKDIIHDIIFILEMIRFFVNPLQLCQLMLDSGILESVNGADKFEDCSSKLFRFTIQQEDNVDDEVFADSSTLADFGTDSIFR